MGFRTGAYATVWEIQPATDVRTKGRISISRRNKMTGEYENEFSGYVSFLGSAAAQKALKLKAKDRIRLGDVDSCMYYSKENEKTYYNFNIFSFDSPAELNNTAGGFNSNSGGEIPQRPNTSSAFMTEEFDGDPDKVELPF